MFLLNLHLPILEESNINKNNFNLINADQAAQFALVIIGSMLV